MRLREPDTRAAADDLLTQWRDHLQGQIEAQADDTAAIVNWPSRDIHGVRALQRHGLQPITVVEPPQAAAWIAGMTRPGATAYLSTMFVRLGARGGGVGAALVRHAHDELDARGIDVTLLHYSQMNPLSAPFWHRMGYRPLWTTWEARPAASLR
jgi:GNAT superfamily N-acetyltransferase